MHASQGTCPVPLGSLLALRACVCFQKTATIWLLWKLTITPEQLAFQLIAWLTIERRFIEQCSTSSGRRCGCNSCALTVLHQMSSLPCRSFGDFSTFSSASLTRQASWQTTAFCPANAISLSTAWSICSFCFCCLYCSCFSFAFWPQMSLTGVRRAYCLEKCLRCLAESKPVSIYVASQLA